MCPVLITKSNLKHTKQREWWVDDGTVQSSPPLAPQTGVLAMKAIICTKYGQPDVLEMQDVAKPTPKAYARAILRLLDDENLRLEIGRNAKKLIRDRIYCEQVGIIIFCSVPPSYFLLFYALLQTRNL